MVFDSCTITMSCLYVPSFTDIGHPLICEWGTLLRFRTRLCVSRLPILTIWVIPQYVRVRMLLTWKNTLQCHEKLPTLSIMGILPYVWLRGWWLCTVRQSYDCAEYDLQPYGMEHPLICRWGCWRFMEVHLYDACRYSPLHCWQEASPCILKEDGC